MCSFCLLSFRPLKQRRAILSPYAERFGRARIWRPPHAARHGRIPCAACVLSGPYPARGPLLAGGRTVLHRLHSRFPPRSAFRRAAASALPSPHRAFAYTPQADTSCHIHETRPSPFGPAPLSVWHLFHPPYPSLAFGFVKWTYYTIERHGAATDTPVAKNGRRTKPRVKRAALRAPQSTRPCGRRSLNGPPRAFLIRTQGFPAKTAPPGAAAACTPRLGHVLCKAASPLKTVLPARLSPERGRFAFAVRNV